MAIKKVCKAVNSQQDEKNSFDENRTSKGNQERITGELVRFGLASKTHTVPTQCTVAGEMGTHTHTLSQNIYHRKASLR